jgi:hypothetical protein
MVLRSPARKNSDYAEAFAKGVRASQLRDHVRSKTPVAMINEVLCKIICHNICVLIQETHELGIEIEFKNK